MHKGSYTPPIVIMQVSDWNCSPEAFHLRANLQRLEFNNTIGWLHFFNRQESIWALFSHLLLFLAFEYLQTSYCTVFLLWAPNFWVKFTLPVALHFAWHGKSTISLSHLHDRYLSRIFPISVVHLRRRHVLLENGLVQKRWSRKWIPK